MSRSISRSQSLLSLLILADISAASPINHIYNKRANGMSRISRGATAGMAIGLAILGILLIVVIFLLVLHFKQRAYIKTWQQKHFPENTTNKATSNNTSQRPNHEKHNSTASAATTLHDDHAFPSALPQRDIELTNTTTTPTTQPTDSKTPTATSSTLPRRQKSLKDRLMGPLYHETQQQEPLAPPLPTYARRSRYHSGDGKTDGQLDLEFAQAQNSNGNRSAVPSYSSRRATRMMMLM